MKAIKDYILDICVNDANIDKTLAELKALPTTSVNRWGIDNSGRDTLIMTIERAIKQASTSELLVREIIKSKLSGITDNVWETFVSTWAENQGKKLVHKHRSAISIIRHVFRNIQPTAYSDDGCYRINTDGVYLRVFGVHTVDAWTAIYTLGEEKTKARRQQDLDVFVLWLKNEWHIDVKSYSRIDKNWSSQDGLILEFATPEKTKAFLELAKTRF